MRYPTTSAKAKAADPAAFAQALALLRASSSRRRKDPPSSLEWSWELACRIPESAFMTGSQVVAELAAAMTGKAPKAAPAPAIDEGLRVTDPQKYCDAKIAEGAFMIALACQRAYVSEALEPGASCPSEIVDAYREKPLEPAADPSLTLRIHMPRARPPGVHQHEIVGGYEKDGERILMDSSGILHPMDAAAGAAHWGGALRPAARAAFDHCAEGGVFRYRNKPFAKMKSVDIAALLATRPVWAQGGVGPSRLGFAPGAPGPSASTLVYPPGSASHPMPVDLGTVAQLGLAAPAAKAKASKPKARRR